MGSAKEKERILGKLKVAMERGEVDEEVKGILQKINAMEPFITTSSCAGRIQVIEIKELGDKEGSRLFGKYHVWPGVERIISDVRSWVGEGFLLLQCQSPIFHVRSKGVRDAVWLLNLAREAGFKYSGIRSFKLDRSGGVVEFSVVLELITPNRLDLPLGEGGELYIRLQDLERILPIFEECLKRGKRSLKRLEGLLEDRSNQFNPVLP